MIFIITGPSGVGKNTIINELSKILDIYFSVSHTTRPMRVNETDGVEYFFVDEDKFNELIQNSYFIEYEKYGDYYYGTSREEINKSKKTTVLDLEVNGATKLLKENPHYVGIFIDISDNILIERLKSRGHDETFIQRRMELAYQQRSAKEFFKYHIQNHNLKDAVNEITDIICNLEEL